MKLRHLDLGKRKPGWNDLNLTMPFLKNHLYLILLPALMLSFCKNKNDRSGNPASVVETNPAYKTLNDSIREFPSDASLFLRRAIRLTQENAHELANPDFQKAWALQPGLDVALPYAANLEILGRQPDRLRVLEALGHQFPSNAQVGRLLADAYTAAGKANQALTIYNDMIAKDSLDPETYYEKAILMEQLRDTTEAIGALQRAYSIQPLDGYGLELAHIYAEQKNPLALKICDFILKHDSAGVLIDPLFIKGIYYANTKQFSKAIAQFDACILRDWKTTDAYLEKGRILFQMKNYDAAMQTFNMAITVTNTDPDAYFWLGRCYEAEHRNMDAVNNYRKAISLDKDFTEARQRMEILVSGFAHPSH
jgi:Flp pilus assembly protein TadD